MNNTNWNHKSLNELEDFLKNRILLPGSEDYALSSVMWAATDHQPAIICLCETTDDVQAAVVLASKKNLKLSVRGGGHDWAGRSFIHEGLVIDLSGMKKINIDSEAKIANIEAGVNAMDLTAAADPFDLVAVVGTSSVVSIAGFTLGGGYGLLSPEYGLGLDNLLGADVVLADGSLVTASKAENADLFWALCGGGGNFGVVTSLRIRLHPAKPLLSGFIMFPPSEFEGVLKGYGEIAENAPDELYIIFASIAAPDGSPLLLLSPTWNGDLKKGESYMDALRKLGTPIMEQIHELRLKDVVASFAAHIVNGRHFYMKTLWLSEITPEVIAACKIGADSKSSPFSLISFFHLHGAAIRVPLSDTAFGLRDAHHVISIAAEWGPEDNANSGLHTKWADDVYNSLAPFALPGGYVNLLGSNDKEQIAHAHGSNLPRLKAIKQAFDPNGVFSAQPMAI